MHQTNTHSLKHNGNRRLLTPITHCTGLCPNNSGSIRHTFGNFVQHVEQRHPSYYLRHATCAAGGAGVCRCRQWRHLHDVILVSGTQRTTPGRVNSNRCHSWGSARSSADSRGHGARHSTSAPPCAQLNQQPCCRHNSADQPGSRVTT